MVGVTGLSISTNDPSYNTLDSKWHLTGTVTNSTSNTLSCNLNVTVFTPNHSTSTTATVKINVYGKLDGGVIAKDQFVCQNVTDMTLVALKGDGSIVNGTTTAKASGGSGSGQYTWYVKDLIGGGDYQAITSSDNYNHTPTTGFANYKRAYTDDVCGTVYTTNELNVTTVNPFDPGNLNLGSNSICANAGFTKTLQITEFTSPATSDNNIRWSVYWQESKNGGLWVTKASQTNLTKTQVLAFTYTINMAAADMLAGDVYQYRYVLKAQDCGTVPSNDVYTLNINNATDYTSQFPDVNITLWYGACDTSIATPTLTPTPASIVRMDELNRIPAGEHNIVWKVNDGCSEATYTQKVTVNYPACGGTVTDANGREYQTVRVGCDCWIAENLKTSADGAAYYNEDNANEGFGLLYDWNSAVGSNNTEKPCKTGTYIQGVCPDGWALPTVAKFNNMLAEFGDIEALKSDDETTWLPGNAGTNTSGFGAKGAGYYEGMQYQRQLGYTYFWTCELNPSNSLVARTVELRCGCGEFTVYDKSKESKVSVRCVKVELND